MRIVVEQDINSCEECPHYWYGNDEGGVTVMHGCSLFRDGFHVFHHPFSSKKEIYPYCPLKGMTVVTNKKAREIGYGLMQKLEKEEQEALEILLEANEKQISKRAESTGDKGNIYLCPVCGLDLGENERYCSLCGQKFHRE